MQTRPYPPGQVPGQPATVVLVHPAPQNKVENYPSKTAVVLGSCQIILGIVTIIFSAVAIASESLISNAILYGIMFILAGAFQVASGKTNTKCWIVTTMVFAILAALFAFGALIQGSIGLGSSDEHGSEDKKQGRYVANGFITFCALAEFIIAIIAAVLTCKPLCCTPYPLQQGVIVTSQYAVQPGQQPLYPGQPVQQQPYPGQPVQQQPYLQQQPYTGQHAVPDAPPAYTEQSASSPYPAYPSSTTYPPPPSEETKNVPTE